MVSSSQLFPRSCPFCALCGAFCRLLPSCHWRHICFGASFAEVFPILFLTGFSLPGVSLPSVRPPAGGLHTPAKPEFGAIPALLRFGATSIWKELCISHACARRDRGKTRC